MNLEEAAQRIERPTEAKIQAIKDNAENIVELARLMLLDELNEDVEETYLYELIMTVIYGSSVFDEIESAKEKLND